jgi:hypothetical protein
MMAPCRACARHVRLEGPCPFCGASTVGLTAPRVRVSQRIGRLAVFTALIGGACGSSTAETNEPVTEQTAEPVEQQAEPIAEESPPPDEPVEEEGTDTRVDNGARMYGGPPFDIVV